MVAIFCMNPGTNNAWYIQGFIKHRRSENPASTTHNSLVKFQWSMAIFYSDESDVDMLYYCEKKLFPEMRNFST